MTEVLDIKAIVELAGKLNATYRSRPDSTDAGTGRNLDRASCDWGYLRATTEFVAFVIGAAQETPEGLVAHRLVFGMIAGSIEKRAIAAGAYPILEVSK